MKKRRHPGGGKPHERDGCSLKDTCLFSADAEATSLIACGSMATVLPVCETFGFARLNWPTLLI